MDWRRNTPSLYRALLHAYPAEFRQEYGEEMQRLLAARLSTESHTSVWLEVLADVAVTAPREHFHILARDLRHCLRLFARTPGFTATALFVLALGIGSAVTVFTLINAVILRGLPYGNAEQLVYMWTPLPRYESLPREMGPSFADVLAWRQASRSFSDITALRQRMLTLNAGDEPVRIGCAVVLGNFFETLQAAPLLGRAIDAADDRPDQRVAVISFSLWRSRFGADPGVIGKVVSLGNVNFSIVGVMPEEFGYPHANDFPLANGTLKHTDIWIPAGLTPQQLGNRMLTSDAAIGRLRPGVTMQQAQSEMSAIESHLDGMNLPEMRGTQSLLASFTETAVGPVRPLLMLLGGAVCLVLLISCGNVASLLMARAVDRTHEMGVRAAMGAPRARLFRQLISESMLLSIVGCALGVLVSLGALKILAKLNPGNIARFDEASIDARVLAFAILISLATGVLFGMLPALRASQTTAGELLRQSGGRGMAGGSGRVHNGLIVANVAFAVVLLSGAGLLIRSYVRLQGEDKGFAPSTLTMTLSAGRPGSVQAATERIAAIPGVVAVGASNALPLSNQESTSTFRVDGYPNRPNQTVGWRRIGGNYFQAMQIHLIAGRFLNATDTAASSVVVSESFAKLYFPNGNATGGRLQRGRQGDTWSTIVGVVADVRHSSLEKAPQPTLYEPSWDADSLAIRTALPPESMIASIRKVVREIDPAIALSGIQTMRDRTSEASARRRFQTTVLGTFAGIAALLALVGIYGLLSYAVRHRSAEIGVRVALGASPAAVMSMVVRQGLQLTAAGLSLGIIAALAASRWISNLLYGVQPLDPLTFFAIPVFMMLAAAIACAVPACKAARIDPMTSLRQQ